VELHRLLMYTCVANINVQALDLQAFSLTFSLNNENRRILYRSITTDILIMCSV
jgi:hypothetical protein